MAQEKMLAAASTTRTQRAMGPELRTISMSALTGEPAGTEESGGAAESSWKRNAARASGEARAGAIIIDHCKAFAQAGMREGTARGTGIGGGRVSGRFANLLDPNARRGLDWWGCVEHTEAM